MSHTLIEEEHNESFTEKGSIRGPKTAGKSRSLEQGEPEKGHQDLGTVVHDHAGLCRDTRSQCTTETSSFPCMFRKRW